MRPEKESQSSDAESVRHPVREGEVVAGKYRIDRLLGVGGMGVVFAATHLSLDQRVALKFLTMKHDSTELLKRFTLEARAAAKIQSEHVGRVFDVGALDSGVPYIVMEYLEGKDLLDVLEADGPLAIEPAVTYVLQACEAIAEAHTAGVVHRDLKPANLFVARRAGGPAIVKVLDFGISKMTNQRSGEAGVEPGITRSSRASIGSRRSVTGVDPGLTAPSALLGSPLYMSPEQLSSAHQVDARTDIWSLGVILYELVTGTVPFNEATMPLIYVAILDKPAPLLRTILPAAPAALEAVISRCLAKDPAARYRDVIELIDALAELAPRQGAISAARVSTLSRAPEREPPIVTGKTVLREVPTISAWGQSKTRPSGLPRIPLLIGGGLVVLAVAILGMRSWVNGKDPALTQAALPEAHAPEAEPPRDVTKSAEPAPSDTSSPIAAGSSAQPEAPPPEVSAAAGSTAPSSGPLATSAPTASPHAPAPSSSPRSTPVGSPPGLATTKVSRPPKGTGTADPRTTGKPPDKGTTGFGDRE
jgi:serine/threonine-protein kinase